MSVLARPAEAPDLKLVAPVSRSWVTGCSSQATLPVRRRLDRYVIVYMMRIGSVSYTHLTLPTKRIV